MSQIEDLGRTLDEILRAIHDMPLGGGSDSTYRALLSLQEQVPVSVDMEPESTMEADKRTKDITDLAGRISSNEANVRSLFERGNESEMVSDDPPIIFLARLDNEDSDGGGEYDEWAEVEADNETGGLKTKVGGMTHATSGESLWEANGITGIPDDTYVLVTVEPGDNILYCFECPAGVVPTNILQPGDVIMRGSTSSTRAGFLFCDGTSYLRADYAALFTAIGTTWGSVDGTHFNVPDMRGRVPVGAFDGTGVTSGGVAGALGETGDYAASGETGGRTFHGITENGHPDHEDHWHAISWNHAYPGATGTPVEVVGDITDTGIQVNTDGDSITQRHAGPAANLGGLNTYTLSGAEQHPFNDTDNRQPWASMMYFIKT